VVPVTRRGLFTPRRHDGGVRIGEVPAPVLRGEGDRAVGCLTGDPRRALRVPRRALGHGRDLPRRDRVAIGPLDRLLRNLGEPLGELGRTGGVPPLVEQLGGRQLFVNHDRGGSRSSGKATSIAVAG